MLHNCTITRIDAPPAPNTGGDMVYTTAPGISIPATMDGLTRGQRYTLDAIVKDATAVIYVPKSILASAPVRNGRVLAATRSGVSLYRIVHVIERELPGLVPGAGGLSHWEIFVQEQP